MGWRFVGEQGSVRETEWAGVPSLVSRAALATSFVLASGLLIGAPAFARGLPGEDEPIEITADVITYESIRQLYTAEGSARIVSGERSIDAEWVAYNRATGRGAAAGDVVVVDGNERVEARFLEFDFDDLQGVLIDGRFDTGPGSFIIAGSELQKTGRDTYRAHEASMTSCRCPDDEDRLPWQLNAGDADVEIGRYATLKNTTFEILGVPTAWLPWLMVPVKTERETGFLFPEFGYSGRNGFEAALPFFWAARHNVNVTLTPRYLTTRGAKPEVEVKTVYGTRSETEIYATYIHDNDPRNFTHFQRDSLGQATNFQSKDVYDENRWGFEFDNDVELPDDWRFRSDIQVVSDNEFPNEFSDFGEQRFDRFMESNAFVFRHFGRHAGLTTSVLFADDRQNPNYNDRDRFLLQRVPNLQVDLLPTQVPGPSGGLAFEMDFDYTYFRPYQRVQNALDLDPAFDTVIGKDLFADIGRDAVQLGGVGDAGAGRAGEGNGRFDEGEPLADRGHRFLLHPHLARSFRLFDSVNLRPEVGWHQTLYTTSAQDFEQRGLFTARFDAETQVVGGFDLPLVGRTTHVMEPRLGWALVTRQGQSSNPLFVPATAAGQDRIRQLTLDSVVLDPSDRIESTNLLTLGLGNRFYLGGGALGPRSLRADLTLSLGYDFAGSSAGRPGLAIAQGRTFLASGIRTRFIFAYDMDNPRVHEGLAAIYFPLHRLPVLPGSQLQLRYRYRKPAPAHFADFDNTGGAFSDFKGDFDRLNQVTASTRLRLTSQWAVRYHVDYSLEQEVLLSTGGGLEYLSICKCWAIGITAGTNSGGDARVNVMINLTGLGENPEDPLSGSYGLGTGNVNTMY